MFPWTMCDFSLMDAIECGIVKLPRVPVADNIPGTDVPLFRNLWDHIRSKMPRKGRGQAGELDPLSIPVELQTALEALYGHYAETFKLWEDAGVEAPPCFIVVCNNTATSKLVYDYIAGFQRENPDGSTSVVNGRLELFQNYDEHGNPRARPRTLLIDSQQLESGEGLDRNFRQAAAAEIEHFRRAQLQRNGDRAAAEKITDHDLLREVMNTVGKQGQLGGSIRCVRLGFDADRGVGREHRDARPRRSRVRDTTAVRAGDRACAAPPVLRPERERPLRRRVRRRARHPVRFHREADRGEADTATRDGAGARSHARPRRPRDRIPSCPRLPGRAPERAARSQVQRRLHLRAHAGDHRADADHERRHHRRGRRSQPRPHRRPATLDAAVPSHAAACWRPSGATRATSPSSTSSAS